MKLYNAVVLKMMSYAAAELISDETESYKEMGTVHWAAKLKLAQRPNVR